MYPSLPTGARFITRRHPYKNVSEVKRGDVVVFTRSAAGQGQVAKYIWRVVALPEDRIEISEDSVIINSQALKHERIRQEGNFVIVREWNDGVSYEVAYDQTADWSQRQEVSLAVPRNHLFLLGDNRANALDSSIIGPIPFDSVVEKKIF